MSSGFAGIHHLALYTHDLDETLEFYAGVLELDVGAIASSPRGRHAFVHLEPAGTGRRGLHFWESGKPVKPDVRAHLASFSSGPGPLAHIALYQPSPVAAAALRMRLDVEGIPVIDFKELGTYAISDPNGIMVEIAAHPPDGPAPGALAVRDGDRRLRRRALRLGKTPGVEVARRRSSTTCGPTGHELALDMTCGAVIASASGSPWTARAEPR